MYKDVKRLLAADERQSEVDPELVKHQMAPLASPVKQALRRVLSISAGIEDYDTLPTASPLKIRDDDPLFDLYLIVNVGHEGTLFLPNASSIAALRSIDFNLRSRVERITSLQFVGVYVKPAGAGKIELGVRVMWGGN